MSVLVVTGTGTGVGKTVVTAAVAALALDRGRRVAGGDPGGSVAVVKPAQTGVAPGEPGDVDLVGDLTGLTELHELARYPDPLAPATAARRGGLPAVDLAGVADAVAKLSVDHRLVLVEGAGGLLVRYDDDGRTLADLARLLRAPVLVVTRPALGTLSDTALTLEALAHRGLELAGVVIGSWPVRPELAERANLADLETVAGRPLAGALPAGAGQLDHAGFRALARRSLAPSLGGTFDPVAFHAGHLP
ncbi:dethiobiotin synthase [Pseudofrankia sp. DC12]|uniref:dethiobiotin synthase n=1 Tax=Pseudofrankia sp. DC12 TaxID=683315 RepID=UPI0005F7801E|nr:dethiobiotin synthase [Pseudofrankia sp. DC12]